MEGVRVVKQSVFDISARMFDASGSQEMDAIKLQKLMYYTFGWYGRLTGQALFGQSFYAMQHGPVVGELLTLHSGQTSVSRDLIESGRGALEDAPIESDSYLEQVIESVWGFYGSMNPWDLVASTHSETPWLSAWEQRADGSRRADLDQADIIEYFVHRTDIDPKLEHLMPPPQISMFGAEDVAILEDFPTDAGVVARKRFAALGVLSA